MEENSPNPAPRTTDVPQDRGPAGNAVVAEHPVPLTSPLTEEELAAFRADIVRKRAAMKEAYERFERAKVVSQAALAFEVSLVF